MDDGEIVVGDTFTVREEMSIRVRTHLSIGHILAAALFARLSADAEANRASVPPDAFQTAIAIHRSYVIAAIFTAVAFVEATINDVFAAADYSDQLQGLDGPVLRSLATFWKATEANQNNRINVPILAKYQAALEIAGRQRFEPGADPYQAIRTLIDVRNSLMHYKPQWHPSGKGGDGAPRRLQRRIFVNPFLGEINQFFPDKYMSHATAAWAVKSSLALTDDFYRRLGLPPIYDHVRADLGTG
jgi:hypothetical protein